MGRFVTCFVVAALGVSACSGADAPAVDGDEAAAELIEQFEPEPEPELDPEPEPVISEVLAAQLEAICETALEAEDRTAGRAAVLEAARRLAQRAEFTASQITWAVNASCGSDIFALGRGKPPEPEPVPEPEPQQSPPPTESKPQPAPELGACERLFGSGITGGYDDDYCQEVLDSLEECQRRMDADPQWIYRPDEGMWENTVTGEWEPPCDI
jgi:hypothetical protein